MRHLTTETCGEAISGTEKGLLLWHKELCPHCKNMEKVIEKFAVKQPDVALFAQDIEKNAATAAEFGVERVPTIQVIRNGKVTASKTGLMNPRELAAFFEKA